MKERREKKRSEKRKEAKKKEAKKERKEISEKGKKKRRERKKVEIIRFDSISLPLAMVTPRDTRGVAECCPVNNKIIITNKNKVLMSLSFYVPTNSCYLTVIVWDQETASAISSPASSSVLSLITLRLVGLSSEVWSGNLAFGNVCIELTPGIQFTQVHIKRGDPKE